MLGDHLRGHKAHPPSADAADKLMVLPAFAAQLTRWVSEAHERARQQALHQLSNNAKCGKAHATATLSCSCCNPE